LADREQIRELLSRFAWTYDEGDFERHADCFFADAVFEIDPAGGEPVRVVGREAIVRMQSTAHSQQGDQRRHIVSNLVFDREAEDSAEIRSYLTLGVVAEGRLTIALTGWFRDVVGRDGGRWRFRSRRLTLDCLPESSA
jgi:3-phenylpropionate/cinnamic acid dioxygenase small subunit